MTLEKSRPTIHPRIIIHGGAGNISRQNLPSKAYNAYRDALRSIVQDAYSKLRLPGATALDVATHAVSLLENNGLFNAGHGAVYTTAGTHELEASVMVSRGYRKRGVGVMKVTRAKNPIKLAREMLIRGEEEDGGGAQGHCQLEGAMCDDLTEKWLLETVKPSYYWTRRRWDEHRRGIGQKHDGETYRKHKRQADGDDGASDTAYEKAVAVNAEDSIMDESSWDGKEYLPQGTVGAVVLDSAGNVCCATSTGGLTNKLPGRIGDTPTLGAGFWAEEWISSHTVSAAASSPQQQYHAPMSLPALISDCIPGLSGYVTLPSGPGGEPKTKRIQKPRAVAMSGTGNGDSFLRTSAVRTAAAIARFQSINANAPTSLQEAVTSVAGPGGILQQSAEDRWQKTGEGEGGIIGIELGTDGKGEIIFDFNCGGMFHAWIDDKGKSRFQVFRDEVDYSR